MIIKFRDVYDAVRGMNQSVKDMGLDLDNTFNDESKGIVTDELAALTQSYLNLYNADVRMTVDLANVRKQVDQCMSNVDVYS
jgi:hypothetical protein